ncbi:hypothetical protein RBB50_011957 [Rhinocladiella similis]
MKTTTVLAAALTSLTLALAAPTAKRSPSSLIMPEQYIRRAISPDCDLSTALDNVTLPIAGTNPALPAPGDSTYLAAVVIGRGTQNYTCGNDSTAAPVATGAIAVLYEASCVAAQDPSLLASLPAQALSVPLPDDPECALVVGDQRLQRAGHHFFNAAKVPTFDFTESDDPELGLGLMSVGVKSPAADPTCVPWLSLNRVDGSQGPIQAIYRLNTASGSAPATCEGQEVGEFTVQYAAQYWVYSSDGD